MDYIKTATEFIGVDPHKFYKSTLFRSDALLLGLNCLEPGQTQQPHDHADQDKFYFVIEGNGRFRLGEAWFTAVSGDVVWAPAGLVHGVTNESHSRLTLLVGIAPAP